MTQYEIGAYNLGWMPIAAFHQHIRQDQNNQFERSILFKQHHRIYETQSSHYVLTGDFILDGTMRAFQATDGRIGIEANDKPVAQVACSSEVMHMAEMKQIETAVGKDNFLSSASPLSHRFPDLRPGFDFCLNGFEVHLFQIFTQHPADNFY